MNVPLFRVAGEFEEARAPMFSLRPTKVLYVWILVATLVVSSPLARGWLAILMYLGISVWLVTLTHRLIALTRETSKLRGTSAHRQSPRGKGRLRCIVWLPVAIFAWVAAACMLVAHRTPGLADWNENVSTGFVYLWASVLTLMGIWWLMARNANTFALPDLTKYYQKTLPSSVHPLIKGATSGRAKYPTTSWRALPDISIETHSAGISLALFGDSDVGPVWKTSAKCFVWYFAPVLIPLLAIFLAPLLSASLMPRLSFLPPIEDSDKLSLGLASMVWASWSVAFFVAMGTRDFVDPQRVRALNGRFLARVFSHWSIGKRAKAAQFFAGTGSTAFHLLALAVVPIYFDYIGLFESPKAEVAAPTSETRAQPKLISPTERCSIASTVEVLPPPAPEIRKSAPRPALAASMPRKSTSSPVDSLRLHETTSSFEVTPDESQVRTPKPGSIQPPERADCYGNEKRAI